MRDAGRNALDHLTCPELAALADAVCDRFDLKRVAYADVRRMYGEAMPCPLRTRCGAGDLWVDKYYLAYQLQDDMLRYAYLTRTHRREEAESYAEAARTRGREICLPAAVTVAFRQASCSANLYRSDTWVNALFHALLKGGKIFR